MVRSFAKLNLYLAHPKCNRRAVRHHVAAAPWRAVSRQPICPEQFEEMCHMHRLLLCICGVVVSAACDGGSTLDSPTGPNPPGSATATLSGRVTEIVASSGLPIGGALLAIAGGGNAGKTATTNANGEYSFSALRREPFSVTVSASGYLTTAFPIDLRGDGIRDFSLSRSTQQRTPFGPGVFRVGTEIPAGRYFSDPPQSGCYWERQRGLDGIIADIIANRFVPYDGMQYIVDILSSDVAFKTDAKCGTWFDSPRHGAQSSIPAGIWLVGVQIQPGTYQTSSGPSCYWERLRHFQYQGVSGVIANSFSAAARTQTVTIAASDIGFSNDGNCGTWTRASGLSGLSSDTAVTQSVADIERQRALYEEAVGERR
jgi:Carboxypeptidase regulatory-like domain